MHLLPACLGTTLRRNRFACRRNRIPDLDSSTDESLASASPSAAGLPCQRRPMMSDLKSPELAGSILEEALYELRQSLAGAVLVSGDAGYDSARRGFNALVDRRPAVIARCLDAADIATAFAFASSYALEVAVRGGGH